MKEKKNQKLVRLQKRMNRLSWKLIEVSFKSTKARLDLARIGVMFGDEGWLIRLVSWTRGITARVRYWRDVFRMNVAIRKEMRAMDDVDSLIAKNGIKKIVRPPLAKYVRFHRSKNDWSDSLGDQLMAAYDKLDETGGVWHNALELYTRQVTLFIDGKWNVSAADDEAEKKAAADQRRKDAAAASKEAVIVVGEKRVRGTMVWEEICKAPFNIGKVHSLVYFKGFWYVTTCDKMLWRSVDAKTWTQVDLPIRHRCDLRNTGGALIVEGHDDRGRYAFSLDGESWDVGETVGSASFWQKAIVAFGDKWILAITQEEVCKAKKKWCGLTRTVKSSTEKTRFYCSDTLKGGWEEIGKLATKDGWSLVSDSLSVRSGSLRGIQTADFSYWNGIGKETPDNQVSWTRDLENWSNTRAGAIDEKKMYRLRGFGIYFDYGAENMYVTADGIDYAKLNLGECTSRYAVGGRQVLKILEKDKGGRFALGTYTPLRFVK